jgi:GT2 family glycosyltransferase
MAISIDTNLTIIIVNWNTREMLKNCLESIMENKGFQKIRIIVVDNASKDGSREMLETLFPEVKLINSGSNIGFGKANNLAIRYANNPLIFFLNPDTVVMKGTLEGMVDFMRFHPTVGAMSCKITYPPAQTEIVGTDGGAQTLGLQWVPSPLKILLKMLFLSDKVIQKFKNYLPYKDPHESGYVSFLAGACLMVRREVLEQIGCFDERFFMYGEDYDLCRRIKDAGWQLYYMSEVKIAHYVGGASRRTTSQFSTLMMCQSVSQLMEKYYGQVGKSLYRIVIFSGSCFRLFILINLIILSSIRLLHRDKSYKEAFSKYFYMFKWSINLEKARVEE